MKELGEGIDPPQQNDPGTLITWSNERLHDLFDGTIVGREQGWWVWNAVMGYADRPMKEMYRQQLFTLAGKISEFLREKYG